MHDADSGAEMDGVIDRGFDLGARLGTRESRNLRRDLQPSERVAERTRMTGDPRGGPVSFRTGSDESAAVDEQLIFAANNYLGLTADQRVQDAAAQAAREVGTGAGASRLVTGDTGLHRQLEREIAACKQTERALVFSSGYAANVGTLAALSPDVIFSDELNHASIIDGCRIAGAETVIYDHCDPDALAAAMELQAREATDGESWLVVTDSVFSMEGDIAPLANLCDVAEQYGAWLMVDEAHATGLYGDGGGIVQHAGLSDRVEVQMGTLSKALASQGGYVAGDETLVEHLLNAARSFVFSTGLAPPAAGAGLEALEIARESDRPDRLWKTVDRLRSGLEEMGYEVLGETQILPVLVGDRERALALDETLESNGIVAPAIRSPTVPEGTSRIRVAPMATHTDEDIDRCLAAFETAGTKLDLI
jgi:8-amino-7-oxononanoate synthase